ncbi:hypothetical protein ASB57_15700 [Bordetella sp. N]|nr:hypothetical protein ASB57_15700 [Bordetella sp. N]
MVIDELGQIQRLNDSKALGIMRVTTRFVMRITLAVVCGASFQAAQAAQLADMQARNTLVCATWDATKITAMPQLAIFAKANNSTLRELFPEEFQVR